MSWQGSNVDLKLPDQIIGELDAERLALDETLREYNDVSQRIGLLEEALRSCLLKTPGVGENSTERREYRQLKCRHESRLLRDAEERKDFLRKAIDARLALLSSLQTQANLVLAQVRMEGGRRGHS